MLVAARDTVERLVVAVVRAVVLRGDTLAVREAVFVVVVLRDVTPRDDETTAPRGFVFVARETAPAAPMHTKHATRKDSAFLILKL